MVITAPPYALKRMHTNSQTVCILAITVRVCLCDNLKRDLTVFAYGNMYSPILRYAYLQRGLVFA